MNKIAVFGLGKVGTLVGVLLSEKFKVTGFDIRAPHYDMKLPFTVKQLDIGKVDHIKIALEGMDAVISALPYYLNHYTISVHELPTPYNELAFFNEFLKSIGITLNDAGGEIKISRDQLLRQSSTVAQTIIATFANGKTAEIAGSYVEFAERLPLPQYAKLPKEKLTNSHRREGFETGNADKIFESTFSDQIYKKS